MEVLYRVPSFSDLKKETIGQTYCNFNKLLKGKSCNDFENIENFMSTDKPLSKFEESLKLILIDSLHLENYVINVLLSQNNHHIKRILKCNWFFQNSLTPERYFEEIFPHVSTSLRNKLITKLSKNVSSEEDAEKFMNFIQENYSRAQAELFLPRCSSNFILKYFTEVKPFFQYIKSSKVLLNISKRYPSLAVDILSSLLNKDNNDNKNIFNILDHKKVFMYLASNHTEIFIPFLEKNFSKLEQLHFGIKLTQRLGPKAKNIIFKENKFVEIKVFKKLTLFKLLPFEEKVKIVGSAVFYQSDKLSFLNWMNSTHSMSNYIRLTKPGERLMMIENAFAQVYNLNLQNYAKLCDPGLLEHVPLKVRLPYVEAFEKAIAEVSAETEHGSEFYDGIKYWKPPTDPENLTYLYSCDIAFPKMKTYLSKAANLQRRQNILHFAVRNCAINKDFDGLKKLVDFVAFRFRNDTSQVFMDFLHNIFRFFPLKSINTTTIQKIEEMLQLCLAKQERRGYDFLMEKCIFHRLGENLDVNVQVQSVIDWCISENKTWGEFIYEYEHEEARKLFFAFYHEILRRVKTNPPNKKYSEDLPMWIFNTMIQFNKRKKKEQILLSEISDLVPMLIAIIKKSTKNILEDFEFTKHLEDNCSHLLHAESRDKLIRFVLHRQTQVIINKLPDFIEYVMSNYYNERVRFTFYASKNLFSFAELINQIKKLLLNQFQNGNSIITKTNALEMLSHLITLEEFEEITKEYRPHIKKKEEKPNIDFLRIERLVPKMIKNITPSWKNFDLVYTYFDNDLFSSVLESYQKCCLHTRVDRLIPLLKACFEKSSKKSKIAVKKETIRMLLEVSNFQEALEHCKNYWDLIDHHSVRTLLFKKVSKSFLERPTEDIFQVFEKFIRECDEVIIEARPALNLIPKKFFTKYVLALWAFSESQEPSFRFGIQNEIISGFHPSNICSLSREFCEDLIKNNLFKNNLDVKKFTSYYVMLDGNEITSKLDFLIEIFKNQKVETNSISKFLNVLRLTSQENIEFSAKVFENLLIKWPFKTHMILYDDCLILKYYCIYHSIFNKVDDSNVNGKSEEFGRELKEFYSNYYNLNLLIPIFQQTLAVFLEEMKFNFKKFNALAAFKGMLQGSPNASIAILVILSIPNHITYLHKKEQTTFKPEEIIRKKELSDVTDLLSGYEDEVVQIYFERKFVSKYPIYD